MRSRPAERFVGISEPEMFTFVYPVVPTKEKMFEWVLWDAVRYCKSSVRE
jgi:hypothetical protein